jgi:hypothetical protein
MAPSTDLEDILTVLAKILLRCFVLGFVFLTFWFALYMAAANFMYSVHGSMFNLTPHDIDIMNYYGMAYFKLTVFVLFLIPYIAVRLVLRSLKG